MEKEDSLAAPGKKNEDDKEGTAQSTKKSTKPAAPVTEPSAAEPEKMDTSQAVIEK